MPQQLLFLELNEINFDYVATYCRRGLLPHLGRLIRDSGVARTVSEQRYEDLEPWIQWVTAHTGLRLADHGVLTSPRSGSGSRIMGFAWARSAR
jgi:hypothetical protein